MQVFKSHQHQTKKQHQFTAVCLGVVLFRFHLAKTTSSMLRRCASFFECFVGFSFKSFNIFVGEGHESSTCRIFGCFFWCTARGHRNLLIVISFIEQAKRTAIENDRELRNHGKPVTSRKLIGRIFTCEIIVILRVTNTIFLSGGNLYKTLQFI